MGVDAGNNVAVIRDIDGSAQSHADLKRWPLSYAQALLWFLGNRWPQADMRNRLTVGFVESLPGNVTEAEVRHALAILLRRHESLRSCVVLDGDEPYQVVVPRVDVPLTVLDVRHEPDSAEDRRIAEFLIEPVSVHSSPPVRFLLVITKAARSLVGVAHHMFFDFWSARMLREELDRLLADPGCLPESGAEIQYVDYTAWERERLEHPDAAAGVAHWVRNLADLPPLRLPTDHPRPWLPLGNARRVADLVPVSVVHRLEDLATRNRATLYMLTATCFLGLLAEESGQPDVAVPTLFSGRVHSELNGVMGYFDNILFLRQAFHDGRSVRQVLAEARQSILTAFDHHDVPLLAVIREQPRLLLLLADPRNVWPLFHFEVDAAELARHTAGSRPEPWAATGGHTAPAALDVAGDDEDVYSFGADLDVTLRNTEDGIHTRILYNVDLFERSTVERMLRRFHVALTRLSDADALDRDFRWLYTESG